MNRVSVNLPPRTEQEQALLDCRAALKAAEERCDSLKLELEILEVNRLKQNEYLIRERDEARAMLKAEGPLVGTREHLQMLRDHFAANWKSSFERVEQERDAALQRAERAEAALRNAPDASRNAGYTVVADPASKNEA